MSKGAGAIFRRLVTTTLVLGGIFVGWSLYSAPVKAVAGTNEQINFQGRLFNAQGATVPDGYYNIQFKIYQDGTGLAVGNPSGALKWTESHLNNDGRGVLVKNGYLSVELGSVTAFGSNVDWNQSVLWLSMNIGNTNGTCASFAVCSPDGEMVPMKRLSSTPYAMNAGKLGGLTASGFIQNTTTLQTANIAVQSVNSTSIGAVIQGATSQSVDVLQVKAAGVATPLLAVSSSGQVGIQPTTDVGSALTVKGSGGGNMLTVDTQNTRVGVGLGGSTLPSLAGAGVEVQGALRLSGGTGASDAYLDNYTTPAGSIVKTKISIPHYNPGANGQIVAMGVPSSADSTASVISLYDARTGAHKPTLAVYSPDESKNFGLSWEGSNTDAYLKNSANKTIIQNNGLNVLTTRNNSGAANVGIGNDASSGYALDVTGDVNSSTQYRLGGQTTLTSSALTFNAASGASIQSATSQTLSVRGGNATGVNANGSNLTLSGGTATGTGANGLVVISTPTFSTIANDANCYTGGARVAASCTIAASSVNSSSAIIVGFTADGQTATLPDPAITTAGRIVYITASDLSKDFTLSVNGGVGIGNLIAMRANTSATMVWNGNDWTAAGASSSTTLQSAYDNTLQSSGGAELIVSKTSATNGLTIRDAAGANSVNGTLLSIQTNSAAGLLSVNSNLTEYASNAGAEIPLSSASPNSFPANTWASQGTSTVTRNITTNNNTIATGQGSVSVTPTAADSGVKNQIVTQSTGAPLALTANNHYNVSFAVRLPAGANTFTDLKVEYSRDGTTTALTSCASAQSAAINAWTKINCSFTAPASGITSSNAIMIRQAASSTRTFYIDNLSVTIAADYSLATDGGADDAVNFSTNWNLATGGSATGTVSQDLADGQAASSSAKVTTLSNTANAGIRNKTSINPLPSTLYRVTAYAKVASGTFNDFKVRYSATGVQTSGSSNYVDCADYNTRSVSTSSWTKITCYISTDATSPTTPYLYFVQEAAPGSTRTFSVDTVSMTLATSTTPNVQVGSGTNGGPTTLFTLDRGASAPIAGDNDALLGSMYYDTTLGKLQCYEADGWGACGSSPDVVVTISPEYTNSVMHGTGVGTMTSDFCSSASGININDGTSGQPTICGSNETKNFYRWTSPQATSQEYSIYVTYQLPGTFKAFASGSTSLAGRVDSTANATISYQVYRSNSSSGLTPCGSAVNVANGAANAWDTKAASGAADPSTCGFSASDSIVFKISLGSKSTANAYIGNLNFTFSNK